MDFVTKLPRTSSRHDAIWVIIDRLTKSAHFLPMHEDYKMDRLGRIYLNEIIARQGLARRSWDVHIPLVEFSYNNSYHSSVRCASFEALYGRKCCSPILWAEVGKGQLIGHELVQETTEKISQIKDRLKAARDHQKSYTDKRRKNLEFNVEPIPPTSSVTALRIPMIKKGEYDLWSMKMRQYIAITDHILWDIITNGDQATTDPASSSVPKTSLAANARRNNEKALNILLSAIPLNARHLT
ncbi:putative reverse transcriptase domain-containing protein [Tanacetum coccineum]